MRFLILTALVLSACSTVKPKHFVPPDSAPVHNAIHGAQGHIEKALAQAKTLNLRMHGQLDSLTGELLGAKQDAAAAERAKLEEDKQIAVLTGEANKTSDALGKAQAETRELKAKLAPMNKWWGVGAIVYGIQRVARHILILVAVLAVVAIALTVLSFFFPVIGVWLRVMGAVVSRLWQRK